MQYFRERCRGGRDATLLVQWFLVILWRWQHMCLFGESREVLWVNAVNFGAVFKNLWPISCGDVINFMINFFSGYKYVLISSSRSNCAITIPCRFQTLLTLTLHHLAAMSFIPVGNWVVWRLSLKIGRDVAKISGEICRTWIIPNQFEEMMHIHFRVLKITCSLLYPPNRLNIWL